LSFFKERDRLGESYRPVSRELCGNRRESPAHCLSEIHFSFQGGFSERSPGKVEPCTLNPFLQKRRKGRKRKTGGDGGRAPHGPRLAGSNMAQAGRVAASPSATGLALVKMSPVRFHCERLFYLPFPQPLASGYAGPGPAAAARPSRMAGP